MLLEEVVDEDRFTNPRIISLSYKNKLRDGALYNVNNLTIKLTAGLPSPYLVVEEF